MYWNVQEILEEELIIILDEDNVANFIKFDKLFYAMDFIKIILQNGKWKILNYLIDSHS